MEKGMRILLPRYKIYWDDPPVKKNTPDMVFLIFATFLLLPVGLFFLLVSVGNLMYGDRIIGMGSMVGCIVGAGAMYYLVKRFRE